MPLPPHTGAEGARPAAVIRPTALNTSDDEGIDLRRLIPAWIASGLVHVALLSIGLLISFGSPSSSVGMETTVVSDVDNSDQDKDPNFNEVDVGDNPDLSLQYPIDRIAENSVPGPLSPMEAVGRVTGQPDAPAINVPAPPGMGRGDGASLFDPAHSGAGALGNDPGGWNGVRQTPGGTDGRSGATRQKLLERGGGNHRSEAAVARGLRWIVRHQALDGHWGLHDFWTHGKCSCTGGGGHYDVAGTSFGLLPLLGAGETHKGTGKSHLFTKNVERALKWLITRQGADGSFSGNGYEHALATVCICEAYGMTADPVLKGPSQRAINCCIAWQNAAGGFRYQPRIPGDLSVTGWFVQALKSGYLAGLIIPPATWAGVNNYLDAVATPDGGGYGYQQPQPAPTVTAVGLLCRQYMGWGPRNPGLARGSEYLLKLPPSPNFRNIYYYYYATQVMYQRMPVNPEGWKQWNDKMRDMLLDAQDQGLNPEHRDQNGSWSPEGDAWGPQLGRLGYTSLTLLTLEVYYRYLPLYGRERGAIKDEAQR